MEDKFYSRDFKEASSLEKFVRLNELQHQQIVSVGYSGSGWQCLHFYSSELKFDIMQLVENEIIEKVKILVFGIEEENVARLRFLEGQLNFQEEQLTDFQKELDKHLTKTTDSLTPNWAVPADTRYVAGGVRGRIRSCESSIQSINKEKEEILLRQAGFEMHGFFDFELNSCGYKSRSLFPLQFEDAASFKEAFMKTIPGKEMILEWRSVQKQ